MYFNTLIIMNEDTLGYGKRSRSPSGYCKLTMPNRIICYVQGLQQLPKGQIYRLYLMSKSKQRSVEIGMFQVGANGNKEMRWVINPDNINNSGINAREVDGALIMVDGEGVNKHAIPLVGFSSEPYTWMHLIESTPAEKPTPPVGSTPAGKPTPPVGSTPAGKPTPPVGSTPAGKPIPPVGSTPAEKPAPPVGSTPAEKPIPPVGSTPAGKPAPPVGSIPAEKPAPPVGSTPTGPIQTEIIGAPLVKEEMPPLENQREAKNVISNIIDGIMVEEILSLKEEIERLNRTIEESKEIIKSLKRDVDAGKTLESIIESRAIEPLELESSGLKPMEVEVELASVEPEPMEAEVELASVESELLRPKLESPPKPEIPEKVKGINEYIDNFLRKFQVVDKNAYQVAAKEMQGIFETRIPINPFEAPNAGIKWVRITHDDLMSFSQLPHEWTNQPLIINAYRDYKHFILGRDGAGIVYYLGIPGVFNPNREDVLNIDKIERFNCCRNIPPKVGETGYWIARI